MPRRPSSRCRAKTTGWSASACSPPAVTTSAPSMTSSSTQTPARSRRCCSPVATSRERDWSASARTPSSSARSNPPPHPPHAPAVRARRPPAVRPAVRLPPARPNRGLSLLSCDSKRSGFACPQGPRPSTTSRRIGRRAAAATDIGPMELLLVAIAAAQCGVFSRAQALAAGYSEARIRHLLAVGTWVRCHTRRLLRGWRPGVVRHERVDRRACCWHRCAPGFSVRWQGSTALRERRSRCTSTCQCRQLVIHEMCRGRGSIAPNSRPTTCCVSWLPSHLACADAH